MKEATKGPNFAGFYTLVIWSCGSPCTNVAIVDSRTGEAFDLPFVGVTGWGNCDGRPDYYGNPLSYRFDSSLLVVTGSLEVPNPKGGMLDDSPCRRFYYKWDGHRLRLLRTVIPISTVLP